MQAPTPKQAKWLAAQIKGTRDMVKMKPFTGKIVYDLKVKDMGKFK
jgi:hypothetical protein